MKGLVDRRALEWGWGALSTVCSRDYALCTCVTALKAPKVIEIVYACTGWYQSWNCVGLLLCAAERAQVT